MIYINKWKKFCDKEKLPWTHTKVGKLLEFFDQMYYQEDASYSAVNTARSAMASFIILDDSDHTVGTHPLMCRYLKGVFKLRTPAPRYKCIWDVGKVLDFLCGLAPARQLSLRDLTLKLCMLLALVSAQRLQTLHGLCVDNISIKTDSIVILVDKLLKQSRPGNIGTVLELKAFPGDKRLCVVHYLKRYIKETADIRKSERKLLITYQKPHKAASSDTIARWIKSVLKASGIDTTKFKAHSTRAAATSAAKRRHLPIADILKQAGWANERTFDKFYNKPLQAAPNFAHTILER